jgi:type IV pilus assembly protein PilM
LNSLLAQRTGRVSGGSQRRLGYWLDALPHPDLVCQITPERVAAARWGLHRLEAFAEEPLPPGAVRPSPAQTNILDVAPVSLALGKVVNRVRGARHEAALLLPDSIVRIFLLGFETFPRKTSEAIPLLQWRLRKSVPFPVEETVLSWSEQKSVEGGLEVVTAVARQSVIGEYEGLLREAGLEPGVVLGETLAALPLVEDGLAVLLARLGATSLTTAVVDGGGLALYRCAELSAPPEPQALLDEIFPAVAYFQDRSHRDIERVRLAGMESYGREFLARLERELGCPVRALGGDGDSVERLPDGAEDLLSRQLASLVGWHLNRGA